MRPTITLVFLKGPVDREHKALDGAEVVLFARSPKPCRGKCHRRGLKGGVVANIELPIVQQARDLGIGQIPID